MVKDGKGDSHGGIGFGFYPLKSRLELRELEIELSRFIPRSTQMINVLKLKLQDRFTSETKVDFYIFRNTNQNLSDDDDPFVLCLQQPNIWSLCGVVALFPKNPSAKKLEAFDAFLPWDRVDTFSSVEQEFFMKHLKPLCKQHGGFIVNSEDGLLCECNMILDRKDALNYQHSLEVDLSNPKQKIELRPLSKSDIGIVAKDYEFGQAHSPRQIELCAKHLASCGLYVDGELASFALLSSVGLINMLHTKVEFRKRGYGVLVMKEMAKTVASMGLVPIAANEPWNIASRTTQLKSGFKFVFQTNWVRFK